MDYCPTTNTIICWSFYYSNTCLSKDPVTLLLVEQGSSRREELILGCKCVSQKRKWNLESANIHSLSWPLWKEGTCLPSLTMDQNEAHTRPWPWPDLTLEIIQAQLSPSNPQPIYNPPTYLWEISVCCLEPLRSWGCLFLWQWLTDQKAARVNLSQRACHKDEHMLNSQTDLLWILVLLLVNCVTLGDLLNISEPQFSLLRTQVRTFAL